MKKQFYILALVFACLFLSQNQLYADTILNNTKWGTKISDSAQAVKKIDPKTLVVGKPIVVEVSNLELIKLFFKEVFKEYPFTSWFFTVVLAFWLLRTSAKFFKN